MILDPWAVLYMDLIPSAASWVNVNSSVADPKLSGQAQAPSAVRASAPKPFVVPAPSPCVGPSSVAAVGPSQSAVGHA